MTVTRAATEADSDRRRGLVTSHCDSGVTRTNLNMTRTGELERDSDGPTGTVTVTESQFTVTSHIDIRVTSHQHLQYL